MNSLQDEMSKEAHRALLQQAIVSHDDLKVGVMMSLGLEAIIDDDILTTAADQARSAQDKFFERVRQSAKAVRIDASVDETEQKLINIYLLLTKAIPVSIIP